MERRTFLKTTVAALAAQGYLPLLAADKKLLYHQTQLVQRRMRILNPAQYVPLQRFYLILRQLQVLR